MTERKTLWGLVPEGGGSGPNKRPRILYKTAAEIRKMRDSGYLLSTVLAELRDAVRPGICLLDLDRIARERIEKDGGTPSFLGYKGYPASICASLNREVVHGIPSADRIAEEGDLLKLDLGVRLRGFHADSAISVPVGKVSPEVEQLVKVTEDALWLGLKAAKLRGRLNDICGAIQRHTEAHGYSVVENMVGHGVGKFLHEEPQVPNWIQEGAGNPPLLEGMTLAVEPMLAMGAGAMAILPDDWTVVTADGSVSAHFEHTIAITRQGVEVLTLGPHDPGR